VQLLGDVRPDAILTRSGARAGDGVYVTGTVGDAAGGLALLQKPRRTLSVDNAADNAADDTAYLVARFARPAARVDFGGAIAGIATAAIDLSDGLCGDLEKLLQASGVAGTIDLRQLPVSPQLRRTVGDEQALAFALNGGDDYELCFTANPADEAEIVKLGSRHGVPVTRIGGISGGAGLTCMRDGKAVPYRDRGYRHF
jgi:thiamine-monophosphate kinase